MISQSEAMEVEAMKWRSGIRSGEIRCRCMLYPQIAHGHLGHIAHPKLRCLWEYAVFRIYEIERQLGL